MSSITVRTPKKIKSMKKLCYGFELLVSTPWGEISIKQWRYWPESGHVAPPSTLIYGQYRPMLAATGGVRAEIVRQLSHMNLKEADEQRTVHTPRPIKAVEPPYEEPVWEEYGFSREEWYALPDETIVAEQALPERCNHVVVGGKLVKRSL